MRKPNVENKYHLTMSKLKQAKIINKEKLLKNYNLINNSSEQYILIKDIGTPDDFKYGSYSSYYITFNKNNTIKVECTCFGGMCNYKFDEFFKKDDVKNEIDLQLQEGLLGVLNDLIDNNVIKIK